MPLSNANIEGATDKFSRFDFDAVGDSYDQWYQTAEGAMYDRLEKKVICRFLRKNTQGRKLLEVGCGTGHWSKFFSDCGFEVIGVDVSEPMIKIAQGKNIANASFQMADGYSLPFKDNSFDVTVAITTLEFVRDAEAVVQEMVRCTRKPGGQLLLGVLNALSRLNHSRQQNSESLYAKAHLFTPRQAKSILEPYGQAYIATVGFIPGQKYLLPLSPFIDSLGRFFHLPNGAFIAGQVRL